MIYIFHADRKERKVLFSFVFHAGAGVVANYELGSRTGIGKCVQRLAETGGTRSEATEGVDSFHFSPFRLPAHRYPLTNARLASAFIEVFCCLPLIDIQAKAWQEYE